MIIWLLDRVVPLITKPHRGVLHSPVEIKDIPKPYPPNKVNFRQSGWFTRVFGGANAVTVGHTVVFAPGQVQFGTYMHELVHVKQWEEMGFFKFVWTYITRPDNIEGPAYLVGNKYHSQGF